MPLSIPPGFAHVAFEFRHDQDPDPWYTTWGIDIGSAGGDFDTVGQRMYTSFADRWKQAFPSSVRFTGVQLTVGQDSAESIRIFVPPLVEQQGTSSSEMLPQNCALLVKKNSALGGRRNRGRMFLPGCLGESQVNAVGIVSGTIRGIFQTYADAFWLDLSAGSGEIPSLPMVILHGSGNTALPVPTPVASLTVDQVISTQRRRLR